SGCRLAQTSDSGWRRFALSGKLTAPEAPMTRISTLAVCLAFLAPANAQTVQTGKKQFQIRCAGCHGEDGTGGGHGPSIVDVRRPRATTLEAVRGLILKGIPEGGMPAFPISEEEASAIAAHVMVLKQPSTSSIGEGAAGD